jgi:hypothetical protein
MNRLGIPALLDADNMGRNAAEQRSGSCVQYIKLPLDGIM